jgi:hypothetical protein
MMMRIAAPIYFIEQYQWLTLTYQGLRWLAPGAIVRADLRRKHDAR